MSIFHTALDIGLALAISVGVVAVLFSPIVLGRFVAGRISGRTSLFIYTALAAVCAYGGQGLYQEFHNHFATGSYWSMAIFFVPLYVALGMVIGTGHKRERAEAEKRLTKWRNQLTADRAAGAAPQRLITDYREIAALLSRLGRREEAAAELRQAVAIAEMSLGGHPGMAEFYTGYLALLKRKADADEIARIKAKRDALPIM
ncbi:MAG: hypothetical protein JSS83_05820 [Cyanobacteria bacterium SZAS LIN-3]|nr:hypothetical protein [Cyanobacteria bacterium SZAS LIN-3]